MKYYLLTTEEMAKHIGIKTPTLRNMLTCNDIPSQLVKGKRLFHPSAIHMINNLREYKKTTSMPYEKAMMIPVRPEDPYSKREVNAMAEIQQEFPSGLLGEICRAVVLQAIDDLNDTGRYLDDEAMAYTDSSISNDARSYLMHDIIPHAEIVGVDSGWIRRVLKDYYLL